MARRLRLSAVTRRESSVKKEHLILVAAVLAGVVFADKIRALPLLNKLPTF
jgi:hypothetical protein